MIVGKKKKQLGFALKSRLAVFGDYYWLASLISVMPGELKMSEGKGEKTGNGEVKKWKKWNK